MIRVPKNGGAVPAAVREFVLRVERRRLPDLSFRADPSLAPLPACAAESGLSHYLLLAAAIDAGVNSNDIRPFLSALDTALRTNGDHPGLFGITLADTEIIGVLIRQEESRGRLLGWQAKREVPRILSEANGFVRAAAAGDFDAWSRQFRQPSDIVDRLARGIYYQGRGASEARKKMWMLMRWLVRPAPDLRLWDHLSPADLMVPVDRHVARFAAAAGIIGEDESQAPTSNEVRAITRFARSLFPDDPACVDYAFFMWGRARSRSGKDPDTCHTLFREAGITCPLPGAMRCSHDCPGES